jgi:hypothetical protein
VTLKPLFGVDALLRHSVTVVVPIAALVLRRASHVMPCRPGDFVDTTGQFVGYYATGVVRRLAPSCNSEGQEEKVVGPNVRDQEMQKITQFIPVGVKSIMLKYEVRAKNIHHNF